jgi:hypothetical protein
MINAVRMVAVVPKNRPATGGYPSVEPVPLKKMTYDSVVVVAEEEGRVGQAKRGPTITGVPS